MAYTVIVAATTALETKETMSTNSTTTPKPLKANDLLSKLTPAQKRIAASYWKPMSGKIGGGK